MLGLVLLLSCTCAMWWSAWTADTNHFTEQPRQPDRAGICGQTAYGVSPWLCVSAAETQAHIPLDHIRP